MKVLCLVLLTNSTTVDVLSDQLGVMGDEERCA
jgi:hypothetical protein